jgi:hypothetical protein
MTTANQGIGSNSGSAVNQLSEKDKKDILKACKEADESLTKIDVERDLVKGIINAAADATGLEKKLVRKIIKTFHKASFPADKIDFQEFSALYEEISNLNSTKGTPSFNV